MIWLVQVGVAALVFLIGILLAGNVGGGWLTVLLFAAPAFAGLLLVRRSDSALLRGSPRAESLFAASLWDLEHVRHMGDVDLLRLRGGRFVAVTALRVVDSSENFDSSPNQALVSLAGRMGDVLATLGGVEVRIEVSKSPRGREPTFRYVLTAESRSERVVEVARQAARALSERMAALGVSLRPCRCSRERCEVTGLASSEAPRMRFAKAPAMAVSVSSLLALASAPLVAPGVAALAAAAALPPLLAGLLAMRAVSALSRGGRHSPPVPDGHYDRGRLRMGGAWYSFATLRKITHSDRFVEPEDVYRLLETLNSSFLYQSSGYIASLTLRRVEEAAYSIRESFKMDMSYYDYETGGGLSRALKARRHQTHLERLRLGERPFELLGVFVLKTEAEGLEAVRVEEDSFKGRLESLGFKIGYVRGPRGIARCIRALYVPTEGVSLPVLEPPSLVEVKALTLDFSWLSPLALDRSPPLVREGVLLGADKRGRPILWHPLAVKNAHIAVFGPMGSGKSTLARTLIIRASRYFQERHGYRPLFLIVDPAGEYRRVAKELGGEIVDMVNRKVNPLLLEGASPHERARFVAEMMRYLKGLKGEETSVLKEAILECYARHGIDADDPSTWSRGLDREVTVSKVYEILVERLRASIGGPMEPAYRSVVDKLRDVAEGARSFSRTDLTVDELFSRGGILCLSFRDAYGQVSEDLQRVIVWTVLQQLRDRLLSMEVQEELRVMVVMDEAHRFIRVGELVEGGVRVPVEPPLSLHLRDTRKFGASYVMITHRPEDMPPGTVELVGTTIALGYPDHTYARIVQEMMGLTPSQVDQLLSSARGQGFLKTSDDPRPLFLTVLPESGALVRDALRDRMALLGLAEETAQPAPERSGTAASGAAEAPTRAAPMIEAPVAEAPVEAVVEPARRESRPGEAVTEALPQNPVARGAEIEQPERPAAHQIGGEHNPVPVDQRPVIRVRVVTRPAALARSTATSSVTVQPRYRPVARGGGSP